MKSQTKVQVCKCKWQIGWCKVWPQGGASGFKIGIVAMALWVSTQHSSIRSGRQLCTLPTGGIVLRVESRKSRLRLTWQNQTRDYALPKKKKLLCEKIPCRDSGFTRSYRRSYPVMSRDVNAEPLGVTCLTGEQHVQMKFWLSCVPLVPLCTPPR